MDNNKKIAISQDTEIRGYTINRILDWADSWKVEAIFIRQSFTYQHFYLQNEKCLRKLFNKYAIEYIATGLGQCIQMFEAIKNMDVEEKCFREFVFEAKCVFFAYIDFVEIQGEKTISEKLKNFSKKKA